MSRIVFILLALALLVAFAITFSKSQSCYSDKHPIVDQIRYNFSLIDPKYMKIPVRIGNSAYTENKSVITICIVDPKTGKYYDMNTLMYVSLHELAHVITPEGAGEHGSVFKKNFHNLLQRGTDLGFYDPNRSMPTSYCKI